MGPHALRIVGLFCVERTGCQHERGRTEAVWEEVGPHVGEPLAAGRDHQRQCLHDVSKSYVSFLCPWIQWGAEVVLCEAATSPSPDSVVTAGQRLYSRGCVKRSAPPVSPTPPPPALLVAIARAAVRQAGRRRVINQPPNPINVVPLNIGAF